MTKIALTGPVGLELLTAAFRDAGYDVMPPDGSLESFRPDLVYDVTSHDKALADEVPGFFDARFKTLAASPYSLQGMKAIVEEASWQRAARLGKVLAVDGDETLWRGILTEDGPQGLVPCRIFQAGLKRLAQEGVALVLLSKNNRDELLAYLAAQATGDGSLLSPDDFVAFGVNWAPKAGNLVEAVRALSVGLESVVFLDDNAHERAQMAAHLPEVACAPWTGWRQQAADDAAFQTEQKQLLRRLREYFFSASGETAEDFLRTRDYRANEARALSAHAFRTHDDYLRSLGLWVVPSEANAGDLDRLVQMAGKTNQFNATTRRLGRADFESLMASPDVRLFVFRAGDAFGAQGLVCYVVVDVRAKRITDFVMSCRAMGRTLENFALRYAEREVGAPLEIDFKPTAKNAPFAEFWRTRGTATFFEERRA